ncbi:hypothetical protein [Nocardia sienata]|nr:hypothetical protein [Nocardia sienata]
MSRARLLPAAEGPGRLVGAWAPGAGRGYPVADEDYFPAAGGCRTV